MGKQILSATSQDVRKFFASHPTMVPAGAEKSVQVSCKGRIKPEAIAVFNKKSGMRYVEGNEPTMPLTYKAKNHRMVTVHLPKSQVRAMAGKSGTRGPLSQKDIDFATEVFLTTK